MSIKQPGIVASEVGIKNEEMSPAVCGGPVAVNDIGKYQKDTSRLEQSFLFSGLHQDFSIQHKKQLHLFVQMSGEIHILPFFVKKRVLLLFVKGQHPLPPNLYLVLLYHKIRRRTIGEAKVPAEPALRHAARFHRTHGERFCADWKRRRGRSPLLSVIF